MDRDAIRVQLLADMFACCLVIGAGGCGLGAPGYFDYSIPLSNGYHLFRTSAHKLVISRQSSRHDTPIIPAKVVDYDFDERFILAKQQRLQRRSQRPNDTYELPIPDAYDYWILDHSTESLYGPLSLAEYNQERKRLGVPWTIRLDVIRLSPVLVIPLLVAAATLCFFVWRRSARSRNAQGGASVELENNP